MTLRTDLCWDTTQASFNCCTCCLPTAVNLQRHCDVKCLLYGCAIPTIAHVLSGRLVALSQDRYTYQHNQVLNCLALKFSDLIAEVESICIHADLATWYESK